MGIARLDDYTGSWAGSNSFRLMPADELATRPAQATLSLSANAHLASLAYRWEHAEDGPQDGLLVFGAGTEADSLVGLWGDSWHQQPEPMLMPGTVVDDGFELTSEYGDGFEWHILIDADSDGLRMRMQNVVPAGHATAEISAGPYDAMIVELRRT
jgi:hypothetical protein